MGGGEWKGEGVNGKEARVDRVGGREEVSGRRERGGN